jgi:putative DNA primase/helicase
LDGGDFKAACTTLAGEQPTKAKPQKVVVDEYPYEDESGAVVFAVRRMEYRNADGTFVTMEGGKRKKTFAQCRPDPNKPGSWIWNIEGVAPLLYRLPQVIEAAANRQMIAIVEGERKVDLLQSWNVPATCNAGGAKKWKAEHTAPLKGTNVVLIPDNDRAGEEHAEVVANALHDIAAEIRVLRLPGLKPKHDIVDWAHNGGSADQLRALIEKESKLWASADVDLSFTVEHSEHALALDFAVEYGANCRFAGHRGKWMFWRSGRWVVDKTSVAFDMARRICCKHAALCDDNARVAAALESASTFGAVERIAKTDRRIAADAEQWDADPFVFNNQETTVDLRTGEEAPPRREDYCTKSSGVPASAGAQCPLWLQFLDRVTDHNAELIDYLQRFLGYCLTGDVREQILVFLYGTGANGKSVFVSTVAGVLGDYAIVAPMETFTESNGDRHPTEIAKLMGARLVFAQETEKGRRWDEAKGQKSDRGRHADGSIYAGRLFRLPTYTQASAERQSQADPAQC